MAISQVLTANGFAAGVLIVAVFTIMARMAYPSPKMRVASVTTALVAMLILIVHDYYVAMVMASKIAHYTLAPLLQVTVYVNGAGSAALDYSQLLAIYIALELVLQSRTKTDITPQQATSTPQHGQNLQELPR